MFKAPFSFNGRIRRTEYGISLLIYYASMILLGFLAAYSEFIFIMVIPSLWFFWAQGAKRCHDVGSSGWYLLIPFYVIIILFSTGHTGENEYGPDPKALPTFVEPNALDGNIS